MKPDMYVNVDFGIAQPKRLDVPADAVLDTGERQTVFVDLGDGYLEPRQVAVGDRWATASPSLRGLTAGERVVSSGTFLIDSESQLKAAASGMGAPAPACASRAGTGDAGAASGPSTPTPAERRPTRGIAMINAHHRVLGANRFVVFLLVARRGRRGRVVDAHGAARRDPRPLRHAGHRLLALGPQPRHHRGPGHLPDRHRAARRAAGEGRPRLLRLRLLATSTSSSRTARTSTGRARACSSTCRKITAAPAAGRADRARARRDRRRLGLPVRARRHDRASTTSTSCARYQDWYLRYALQVGARASPRSRRSAASSGSTRSTSIPTACAAYDLPLDEVVEAVRSGQQRRRRPAGRDRRRRVHGARPRLRADRRRPRRDRARDAASAARRSACATSAHVDARARDAPRRRRPRRHGRRRRRHRRHAPGRERARRHRPRQGRSSTELEPSLPAGRRGRHDLRPLRADPALDRQPEARR